MDADAFRADQDRYTDGDARFDAYLRAYQERGDK